MGKQTMTKILIRSVFRKESFSATVDYLLARQADPASALPLAIKKNHGMLAHLLKAAGKEALWNSKAKEAVELCNDQQLLDHICQVIFGDRWKEKRKRDVEGQHVRSQIKVMKEMLKEQLSGPAPEG